MRKGQNSAAYEGLGCSPPLSLSCNTAQGAPGPSPSLLTGTLKYAISPKPAWCILCGTPPVPLIEALAAPALGWLLAFSHPCRDCSDTELQVQVYPSTSSPHPRQDQCGQIRPSHLGPIQGTLKGHCRTRTL